MKAMRIEGYASKFNERDLNNDIVVAGAFKNSLMLTGVAGVKMLYQHQSTSPIGVWDDIYEDAIGLFVRGRIIDLGSEARMVKGLVENGIIDGLSIGFRTLKSSASDGGRLRVIKQVELWEISLVTFPMLSCARFKQIPQAQTA
jgi:HK97 family phage prohead protease